MKRTLLGVCLLLILLDGFAEEPPVASSLQSTASASLLQPLATVPFEQLDRLIFVGVRVNDSQPLRFVLSSGRLASGLSKARAGALGLLQRGRSFKARTENGWDQRWKLPGIVLQVGDTRFLPAAATAGTLPDSDPPADGVLGADLFQRFVVELDFARHVLRLYDRATFQLTNGWTTLPIAIRNGRPVLPVGLGSNPSAISSGSLLLSTGYRAPLRLDTQFARSHPSLHLSSPTLGFAKDPQGQYQASLGKLPAVQLGPISLTDTETLIADRPAGMPAGLDGVVGGLLLQRFNLVFDFSRHQLSLQPNPAFSEAEYPQFYLGGALLIRSEDEFMIPFCGAMIVAEPPSFSRFRVIEVRRNSAAYQAGMRRDDVLVALDERPPEKLELQDWMQLISQVGRPCRVDILRGGAARTLSLNVFWPDSFDF